jgi:hypothetical protein
MHSQLLGFVRGGNGLGRLTDVRQADAQHRERFRQGPEIAGGPQRRDGRFPHLDRSAELREVRLCQRLESEDLTQHLLIAKPLSQRARVGQLRHEGRVIARRALAPAEERERARPFDGLTIWHEALGLLGDGQRLGPAKPPLQ